MKVPWRFQGDISYGETDPVMTVFMGEVLKDEAGNVTVRQDVTNPVVMKLSALGDALKIADPVAMTKAQSDQIAKPPVKVPTTKRRRTKK
jgi:hypothetical protein